MWLQYVCDVAQLIEISIHRMWIYTYKSVISVWIRMRILMKIDMQNILFFLHAYTYQITNRVARESGHLVACSSAPLTLYNRTVPPFSSLNAFVTLELLLTLG